MEVTSIDSNDSVTPKKSTLPSPEPNEEDEISILLRKVTKLRLVSLSMEVLGNKPMLKLFLLKIELPRAFSLVNNSSFTCKELIKTKVGVT